MELYRIKFIMERRMVSSSGEKLVVVLVEVAPAPVSSYGKDGYQEGMKSFRAKVIGRMYAQFFIIFRQRIFWISSFLTTI
jgi:hypothetical protein